MQANVRVLAQGNRLNVRMPFVDMQFGDGASPMNMVEAQIRVITKTAPISPGHNLYPNLAHGHVYRGAGEVPRGPLRAGTWLISRASALS